LILTVLSATIFGFTKITAHSLISARHLSII
jgi:hypothetical protein